MMAASAGNRSLYNQGAKAARFLFDDDREWYVCPLCMCGFAPQAVDRGLLSKEHVPPRSNGGKKMVLTCKPCNNAAGSSADSHARSMEDIFDFGQGTMPRTVPIELKINGLSLRGGLRAVGDRVEIEIHPKANNPEVSDQFLSMMQRVVEDGSWADTKFDLQFKRSFKKQAALVSWLRAGYLAAFAALGYRYIIREPLDVVREQISNPEAEIIDIFSTTTADAPSGERRILLISEPRWMDSVCVQMGRHMVFLPPVRRCDGFYARFEKEVRQHSEAGDISGKVVPWPSRPTYLLDQS